MIADVLDVGAVDATGKPVLTMFVVRDARRYRITVQSDTELCIDTIDTGSSYWYAVDISTGIGRSLVGYAIRRAIYRGLGRSEVMEVPRQHVIIDLGTWEP